MNENEKCNEIVSCELVCCFYFYIRLPWSDNIVVLYKTQIRLSRLLTDSGLSGPKLVSFLH